MGYLVLGGGVLLVLVIVGVSLLLHSRRGRTRATPARRASWPRTESQPLPGAPPPRYAPLPIDTALAQQDPATIRAPLDGDIPPRPTRRAGALFADDAAPPHPDHPKER